MEKYQTLGRRFAALIIDSILLVIVNTIIRFGAILVTDSQSMVVITNAAMNLLDVFYFVLLHAYCGQTVGKLAVGVVVLDDSEKLINFGQSVVRSLPQLIPALFVISMLSPNEDFEEKNQIIGYIITGAAFAFQIADIIVCLINEKHRALHDLIAGTIVVRTNV